MTKQELQVLYDVRLGADITSPVLAKQLREVESKWPELIEICEPMTVTDENYDVHKPLPYFGAIPTMLGMLTLRRKGHTMPVNIFLDRIERGYVFWCQTRFLSEEARCATVIEVEENNVGHRIVLAIKHRGICREYRVSMTQFLNTYVPYTGQDLEA
jgi:hypothetical protein